MDKKEQIAANLLQIDLIKTKTLPVARMQAGKARKAGKSVAADVYESEIQRLLATVAELEAENKRLKR